jgi:hypothetical protein
MGVVDKELLQCKGSWEQDVAMLMAERVEGTERVTPVTDMRNGADGRARRAWPRRSESFPPSTIRLTKPKPGGGTGTRCLVSGGESLLRS